MRTVSLTLAVAVVLGSPWSWGLAEPPAEILVQGSADEPTLAQPQEATEPVERASAQSEVAAPLPAEPAAGGPADEAAPPAAESPSDPSPDEAAPGANRPSGPPRPLPPPPVALPTDPAYDAQGEPTGPSPFVPERQETPPGDEALGNGSACEPDGGAAGCQRGCECRSRGGSCTRGCCCRERGYRTCRCPRTASHVASPLAAEGPRRFFEPRFLKSRDITLGGWVEQGVSGVANQPADRYNGPVVFNDRDGEYQMNQLNFFLERKVDTGGCGLDLGGRIDFLYGTDARFVACRDGLEADWDQDERFYQAALPQFCLDVGVNDWTVRMGHFYTIIGYEVLPAGDNFFYSHSYTMQYGEPFTHTGLLATYRLGEHVSMSGGFHRGWDRFDDNADGDQGLSFLGGAQWASHDGRRSVAFAITSGEEGVGNNTVMYSLVGTLRPTKRLKYVIQHDYGQSAGNPNSLPLAEWYGINQYVLFDLNAKWAVGTRIEWFRDKQGVRVHGCGEGNLAVGPYAGDFYEVTAGLNWRPRRNVTVRPEVRWDWYHGPAGHGGSLPYDAGDSARQFLYGCDLIVQF